MRVLWFTNTPCNADEYFKNELKGSGGWLKALDQEIQKSLELYIAFYYKTKHLPFKYQNTNYIPIHINESLIKRFIRKYFNKIILNEHLNIYINIINTIKPDIIHIHGTENPFACIVPYVQIPVVISIQGNVTIYYHKYFSGIERHYLNINILNEHKMNYYKFKKMAKREINNLQHCKYIIGRTDWDRRISRIFAPKSKYYHCDEILRDVFYNTKWNPPYNKRFRIITTTTPVFYKGLETIFETMYELGKLGLDIEWLIAGIELNNSILKVIKRKLRDKYTLKNIIFLGKLNDKELVKNLLEADLYVMPSHIENSPNNLCEAMILGLPCISTFVGGTGSIVNNNEDGILVQDGDPWALAGAILEIIKNRGRAIDLGSNARQRALIRHDKTKIVNELINIYNDIIISEKLT
ncbi:glycosyltransferase family 4 protein [Rosettibacter firmus]|uniref:glycosyltransferase family 4 protein n=1 Tax=Rosettibacter firmus TaxID=3111522 RepID=UPI00336BB23B